MTIDYAKFVRLQGQFDELNQLARGLTETARDVRQQLRGMEANFAQCVNRTDDAAALDDSLKALDWPQELKHYAGLDPRLPRQLVAAKAQLADLNSRHAAARERAAAFGAWFSRVKTFAQNEGVTL